MLTDTQERQDLEAPAGPPGPLWRGRGNDSQGGEWVLLGNSPFTEPAYKGCGGRAAARGLLGKHPLHLHQLLEELVAVLLVMDAPGPPALLLNHPPGRDGRVTQLGQRSLSRSCWMGLLGDLLSWLNKGGDRFMCYTRSLPPSSF